MAPSAKRAIVLAGMAAAAVAAGTLAAVSFGSAGAAPRAFIYWANNEGATIGRANLNGTAIKQSFITGAASPAG